MIRARRRQSPARVLLMVLVALLLVLASGGSASSASAPIRTAAKRTITVLAASSLRLPLRELADELERQTPGLTVSTSFAGSPLIVTQVTQGAPADVVVLADSQSMTRLRRELPGLSPPVVAARNGLAVAVERGNPLGLRTLSDLTRPGLVLALGGPNVPIGRYARAAFGRAGLSVPAASAEPDVAAVVNKVALGEADAGVVYRSDIEANRTRISGFAVPREHDVTATYPMTTVTASVDARSFMTLVRSARGQQVLRSYGFR